MSTPYTNNFPGSLNDNTSLGSPLNNAVTQIDGNIDASQTTIPVDSTSLFPSNGHICIGNEIIYYTGKTGTSFTGCIRGSDGTTAASHTDNPGVTGAVGLRPIAAMFKVLRDAIIAIETKIGAGATLDAAKIHDGSVSNTKFGYLNGVTDPIQTQLSGKAASTLTLTAGNGLTGGGDLSANRSFAVGAGTGIAVNADDVALDINGLTTETSIADGDFVAIYDVSASALRKMTKANFVTGLGGGSSNPFDDGTALVKGSADATKLLRFEVDNFTTGTTRVVTFPDANITVARIDAAQTFTGTQTFLGIIKYQDAGDPGNDYVKISSTAPGGNGRIDVYNRIAATLTIFGDGIASNGTLQLGSNNDWRWQINNSLLPWADNSYNIGSSSLRVHQFFLAEFWEGDEMSDPSAPASNKGRLYYRDNGSGKTQLVVRFPTGAVQVIATEP